MQICTHTRTHTYIYYIPHEPHYFYYFVLFYTWSRVRPDQPFHNFDTLYDVTVLHTIRHSPDLKAVKLWKGQSGRKGMNGRVEWGTRHLFARTAPAAAIAHTYVPTMSSIHSHIESVKFFFKQRSQTVRNFGLPWTLLASCTLDKIVGFWMEALFAGWMVSQMLYSTPLDIGAW